MILNFAVLVWLKNEEIKVLELLVSVVYEKEKGQNDKVYLFSFLLIYPFQLHIFDINYF